MVNHFYILFITCIVLLITGDVFAENTSYIKRDSVIINFKFDDFEINKEYRMNKSQIQKAEYLLTQNNIEKVFITSYASIEGESEYNKRLTELRSISIKTLIKELCPNIINDKNIFIASNGEDWEGLLQEVHERKWIPYKKELIKILEDKSINNETKKSKIKEMNDGVVYKYLNEYVFWKLRNSSSIVIHHSSMAIKPKIRLLNQDNQNLKTSIDKLCLPKNYIPINKNDNYTPLLAVKSNLLFDVSTALNAGIEFPIKRRLSIAGDWTFPFWSNKDKNFTLDILYGELDIKYWLGDRFNKPIMTGWYCNIYGGYGKYDIQLFCPTGTQGEMANIGIGTGYSHQIFKNIRMEYSIGVGYIKSNYYKYQSIKNTEYGNIKVVKYPMSKLNKDIISLNKLSVSLIWIINRRTTK